MKVRLLADLFRESMGNGIEGLRLFIELLDKRGGRVHDLKRGILWTWILREKAILNVPWEVQWIAFDQLPLGDYIARIWSIQEGFEMMSVVLPLWFDEYMSLRFQVLVDLAGEESIAWQIIDDGPTDVRDQGRREELNDIVYKLAYPSRQLSHSPQRLSLTTSTRGLRRMLIRGR